MPLPLSARWSRYDDPDGRWKTRYCARDAEGAIGECLGDLRFNAAALARIEAYLDGEPDDGFDEIYSRPLTADDTPCAPRPANPAMGDEFTRGGRSLPA